jgi:uncharacterized protein YodC (DUF2158 family)
MVIIGDVTAQQQFRSGDTVRLKGGNDAHLMSVKAASEYTVLCAWFGPSGKIQYAPYPPEELELVTRGGPEPPAG